MIPKFRAWDRKNKVMRDVKGLIWEETDLIGHCNLIAHCPPRGHEFNEWFTVTLDGSKYQLMQSTGLKDKNGVGIFEGDVVSVSVRNGFDYLDNKVCIVKNSIDYSGLVCATVDEDLEYRIFNTELFEEYTYEVIGNIYENSELLEEQQ
ncbi:DNA-packaging protein [Enterococcus faecium]|uniref:YopX family protein n=1 Tax=Enterococcus faecium TaxID=1352 RepID=UPI00201F6D79|nr:YopX family protein [Enterococcus faecium]MCL6151765.1 DNA-packaging protein [Enterococcus faecium]